MLTIYDKQNSELILRNITQRINDLPALPRVVTAAVDLISNPDITIRQLEDLIRTDQALAIRVLKMANSAFYGFSRQIVSIGQAVKILGFNTLRSLLVSSSTARLFLEGDEGRNFHQCLWNHSLLTAVISRLLAARGPLKFLAEEIFTAGLLHDLGKKIVWKHFPGMYERIEILSEQKKVTPILLENQALGFNHAHVGALLAENWNLPPALVEAVRYHHSPDKSEGYVKYIATVNLADTLAKLYTDGSLPGLKSLVEVLDPYAASTADFPMTCDIVELNAEIDKAFSEEKASFEE